MGSIKHSVSKNKYNLACGDNFELGHVFGDASGYGSSSGDGCGEGILDGSRILFHAVYSCGYGEGSGDENGSGWCRWDEYTLWFNDVDNV